MSECLEREGDSKKRTWYDPTFTCGRLLIVLIPLIFAFTLVMCVRNAPGHYRTNVHFPNYQLSNMGNYQASLGWFSLGLSCIALCFAGLVVVLNKARDDSGESGLVGVLKKVVYNVGAGMVVMGLLFTGSFQQSFNKPLHPVGVSIIFIGILIILIYDILIWASGRKFQNKLLVPVLFLICVSICGVGFIGCDRKAKSEWNRAEDKWFAAQPPNRDETGPCPERSTGNRDSHFPCKSKTLWDPTDPGWTYYRISANFELALFILVVLYPWVYWNDTGEQTVWGCLRSKPRGAVSGPEPGSGVSGNVSEKYDWDTGQC